MINDQYRSQYRLPYALYEQIKAEADAQKRSLNAEIVLRLEASFAAGEKPEERDEKIVRMLDERDERLVETIRTLLKTR